MEEIIMLAWGPGSEVKEGPPRYLDAVACGHRHKPISDNETRTTDYPIP